MYIYKPNYYKRCLIATERGQISIINVYNPSDNRPITTWGLLQQTIDTAEGEIIVLGDFNTHHTAWGGQQATVEPQATHLLNELATRGIVLTTPTGEPTWKRGIQESTIDLTFMQEALADRLAFCGPENAWALTADHIPIQIALDVAAPAQQTHQRYAIKKLDQEKYLQEITNRLATTPEATLEDIQRTISNCLDEYCPKVKPSKHTRREWSPVAAQLLAGLRRARRQYSATGEAHHQ